MIYFTHMKPGREEILELGIARETVPAAPESLHYKNIEQAVEYFEEFARSFRPQSGERATRTNMEYRTRAMEEFSAKTKGKIKEISAFPPSSEQMAKNACLLLGSHALITQEIVRENREMGTAFDKNHLSHLTEREYYARLMETVEFQQKMTRFILQYRNIPGLDMVMQRYWTAFQNVSSAFIKDPDFSGKQERGIERAVTASHLLEQQGWRTHRPRAKEDMEGSTDAYATGITHADKHIILALQFKPSVHAMPVVDIDVLYPFPPQPETDKDTWNLIANVKKHRIEKSDLPLFPVFMSVPSYRETPLIRKGTGLLASPASINTLLDEKGVHALEYAETLADMPTASKPKKRRIIYDAQAK